MTLARARALTGLGAAGLFVVASVVGVTFTRAGLRPGQRIAIDCAVAHSGPVVHVTLSDRGTAILGAGTVMVLSLHATPTTMPSGEVTFVATNVGALKHSLFIWPVRQRRDASTVAQLASASPSLGEVSRSCGAGRGNGIAPGASGWISLSLTRGIYVLACDQRGYYTSDMVRELRVT